MVAFVIVVMILLVFWLFSEKEKPDFSGDKVIFKSSFTRGGDLTAPESLIFDYNKITWNKNRGVNWLYSYSDTITIPYKNIVGIKLHSKMIGTDIEIIGNGVQSIYASKFSGDDAKRIEKIIHLILEDA